MTPYRLAQISGVDEFTISRLRSGHTKSGAPKTIVDIARALQAPVDEFVEAAGRTERTRKPARRTRAASVTLPVPAVDSRPPATTAFYPERTHEFVRLSQVLDHRFLGDGQFQELDERDQELIVRQLRSLVYQLETFRLSCDRAVHRNGDGAKEGHA